ncbi:hypothetical protein [Stratiformator vulcanicus]|uniref:Uncharacterized protein n=1 Tax=Stratiformator vulcanicus TaxID=2527980 RepID=A0A517QZI2_9PLAN|nr:hypothetical protein [Stratiformator vulcanicus]QDT37057.1 hypothetical protein Pan189_14230 [Stratiformator vulcanicus]
MPSPATKAEAADFSEFLGMVLRDSEVDLEGRSLEDLLALFREQCGDLDNVDLKAEIELGMEDLRAGRFAPLDIEETKRRGRERLAQAE